MLAEIVGTRIQGVPHLLTDVTSLRGNYIKRECGRQK